MRATVVVTDDNGTEYAGTVELAATPPGARAKKPRRKGASPAPQARNLDFTLSCRAFVKEHVTHKSSGAQKFAMVAAWLAKGDAGAEVRYEDISREWKKAQGLLGGEIANVYGTRAKDNGWVDSPRTGVYVLRAAWREAFGR